MQRNFAIHAIRFKSCFGHEWNDRVEFCRLTTKTNPDKMAVNPD